MAAKRGRERPGRAGRQGWQAQRAPREGVANAISGARRAGRCRRAMREPAAVAVGLTRARRRSPPVAAGSAGRAAGRRREMGRSDDGSREFARRAIGREASERAARDRGRGAAGAGGADLVVLRDRGGDRPAGRLHGRAAGSGPRPLPGGLRRRRPGLRPASTRRGRRELLGRQAAWRRQSALRDRPLRPAVVGTGTDAPHSRRSRALRPVPGRQLRFGGTRLLSDDGRQSARRLPAAGRPPGAADAARRRGPDPPRWRRALAGAAVLARSSGAVRWGAATSTS